MTVESGQGAALRCANHPNTETHLRCSRCGKPICVKCVIPTPVGGRCRECANLRKSPILVVSPVRYAKAVAFGLGAAIVSGLIWGSIGNLFGLSILLLFLLGYVVGEAVSRGADGRISRGLMVLAGASTVLAVLVGRVVPIFFALPSQLPFDARFGAALNFGLGSLTGNVMQLLFVVLAVVVAVSRIR